MSETERLTGMGGLVARLYLIVIAAWAVGVAYAPESWALALLDLPPAILAAYPAAALGRWYAHTIGIAPSRTISEGSAKRSRLPKCWRCADSSRSSTTAFVC